MKLPESFVLDNLKEADGCTIFGVPLNELNREELLACVVAGWAAEKRTKEECSRRMDFMEDLRKAR